MGIFKNWSRKRMGETGFLYKHFTGRHRPSIVCNPGKVDCPEQKKEVRLTECMECGKFKVWHEKDGDVKRCWYEFKDLKSRGFYDGTWDDHPENFDPDTFAKIQERKRLNREVNRELESERLELREKAEQLSRELEEEKEEGYYEEDEEPEEEPEEHEDEEDYF